MRGHLAPELLCGRGRGEHGAPVGVPGLVIQPQLVTEPVHIYNYLSSRYYQLSMRPVGELLRAERRHGDVVLLAEQLLVPEEEQEAVTQRPGHHGVDNK